LEKAIVFMLFDSMMRDKKTIPNEAPRIPALAGRGIKAELRHSLHLAIFGRAIAFGDGRSSL
jgi:hypothetical protein